MDRTPRVLKRNITTVGTAATNSYGHVSAGIDEWAPLTSGQRDLMAHIGAASSISYHAGGS